MHFHSLPDDVLTSIASHLCRRDIVAVGATSTSLHATMHRVLERQGVRLRDREVARLGKWLGAHHLVLSGTPRRYARGPQPELPLLPPLANLRTLTIQHCRIPASVRFWPHVFAACPALVSVRAVNDFFLANYAADVMHCVDLVTHGAGRLRTLDIEGSWLVLYPVNVTARGQEDVHAAVARVQAMPAVPSTTLVEYRAACQQVPIAVDSSVLRRLVVDERHEKPLVMARMGPASRRSCRELEWHVGWSVFDGGVLTDFTALEALALRIEVTWPAHASRCLESMASLPAGLESLTLTLDTYVMTWDDSAVEWGRPLQHLTRLKHLRVELQYPVSTIGQLFEEWMGAPPAGLETVTVCFQESIDNQFQEELSRLLEEDADPVGEEVLDNGQRWMEAARDVDSAPLVDWLHTAPHCIATVKNMRNLAQHPAHTRLVRLRK
jgi:hypothetical protein